MQKTPVLSWTNPKTRAVVWQVLVLGLLAFGLWLIVKNLESNLAARGIEFGFGFLNGPAGFDISEQLIAYTADNTYWRAYAVGVLNTLKVAITGVILASALGLLIAIGALSANPLLAALCRAYVEFIRNVPLLLQLFFWYLGLTQLLPDSTAPVDLSLGFYLDKAGLHFPWFGEFGWELPEAGPFGLSGGSSLSTEFIALLAGLSLYTSAFIAEVVRAGILSVPRGQTEAANALGLSAGQRMRLVILPQALRVIIPPVTNQYLNLTKNSSLAVAIGYPELVSVATTTLNQTGHAVEAIAVLMGVYLTLSLLTSWLMQIFERRVRIQER